MAKSQKAQERAELRQSRPGLFARTGAFFTSVYRLAWRGLITAVAMGVFFGLVIGIGGEIYQVDTEQLYVMAGLSGWVSGLVAMLVVFSTVWRKRRDMN